MTSKNKEKLITVTIDDCEVQTFRGSGAGGQHKNKTSSGVRIIHHPSGAVGRATDAREQFINKQLAFKRMVDTKEFKNWLKIETSRITGIQKQIEDNIDKLMNPKNIKIETKDDKGLWKECKEEELGK